MGWTLNGLLTLTLIPIILNLLGIDNSTGVMKILENRALSLLVLFLISFIQLSDAVITSLGRKSNPALMMAVSFMFIIMVGSGMLLMPRCIQEGIHLSWIDSLFTATSAVCVTGLTTIDVPSTFTSFGQLVIMMLMFFNAVSPRTAGFISVNLNNMCIQSIFIYTVLMWIGGASQSTAGGVKVNAFAVAFLNIRAIIHGTTRGDGRRIVCPGP